MPSIFEPLTGKFCAIRNAGIYAGLFPLWKYMMIVLFLLITMPHNLFSTNVRDYGAKGDGTTDDTEAIYTAIRAAEDGEILFSKGVYRITRSINIALEQYGPLTIKGVAGASTIIMDGPGAAFVIRGTHEGSALPATVKEDVWARENFFLIESLEIVGKQEDSDGIRLVGLMQPVVRNCLIRNSRYGIHLTTRNRNVQLLGNHIYDGHRIGVYLDQVNLHQINIHDNHISYCKEGGIVARNSEIRNIQIVGNDIEYNFDAESKVVSADVFFDISERGSIREGTISGNNIQALKSPGGANIHFIGNPDSRIKIGLLSIDGNHISNQETLIKLKNVKGISITGNTFIRGFEHHILMESADNIVIQGNVFDHNADYFKGDVNAVGGIRMASCRDVIFGGNILEGVARGTQVSGGALEVDDCNRITINASHILNSLFRAIDVRSSNQVSITGCTLYNEENPLTDGILVGGDCRDLNMNGNRISETIRSAVFYGEQK